MFGRIAATGAALVLLLAAAACDEKLSDVTGPTPNLEPTFSSIQQEIFSAGDSSGRSACTECHIGPLNIIRNGRLVLTPNTSYASLVGVRNYGKPSATLVVAGDAENSYLIHKLEGRPGITGGRMPNTGRSLTAGQIAVIKRWIAIGAPNN